MSWSGLISPGEVRIWITHIRAWTDDQEVQGSVEVVENRVKRPTMKITVFVTKQVERRRKKRDEVSGERVSM